MDYVRWLKTLSEKVLLPFNEFSKQLRVVITGSIFVPPAVNPAHSRC